MTTSATSVARSRVHGLCLLCGGLALISIWLFPNQYFLLLPMMVWGITWSSILTLPYAMLSEFIPPQRRGIYQGIFNFYVVLPEITVALGFGWIMHHWLNDNCLLAIVIGGVCLVIAAVLTLLEQSTGEQ
jgi:maltose/moltooligosaccharide transporter